MMFMRLGYVGFSYCRWYQPALGLTRWWLPTFRIYRSLWLGKLEIRLYRPAALRAIRVVKSVRNVWETTGQ